MPVVGRRAPSLDHLFVAAFALLGVRVGAVAISDNSAFWHIRVGIDALDGAGIPRHDPYSWTAAGEPWVVQSWLAELAYGVAHRLGGFSGVVVLNAVTLGVVVGLMAALAATGRPRRTFVAASLGVAVSVGWWSPRPLLFGLVAFGATIMLRHRRSHAAWFALIGALWVNVHGSFVLGAAWLVLTALGTLVDRRRSREGVDSADDAAGDLRATGLFLAGAVVGAVVSPPGWRLLTFPATAIERREVFATVNEWQRPDLLAGPVEMLALGGLIGAGVVLALTRPPWRQLAPAVAFVVAALASQRNMVVAGLVLAPALSAGLRSWRPAPARSDVVGSVRLNRAIAAVIGVTALLFLGGAATAPALDLSEYPVRAARWMESEGLRSAPTRIAHTDVAGGWLILSDGRDARVFIDDRVDMYPPSVVADYRALRAGGEAASAVLEEWEIDAVLWPEREERLLAGLAQAPGWERAYTADGWQVWVRR